MELPPPLPFRRWATAVPNVVFPIGHTRWWRDCGLFWLSNTEVLVWYTSREGCLHWEHVNTRTRKRYRERGFGKTLAQYIPTQRGGHFEPQALSPDAQWLLGSRQAPDMPFHYEAVGTGGRVQTWVTKETQGYKMLWLPNSQSWCTTLREAERLVGFWLFSLGKPRPKCLRPRQMPPAEQNAFVIGVTSQGTAILASGNIAHPHGADHGPAELYAVPLQEGAEARRIGTLILPKNLNCTNIQLSPKGTHLLLQCYERFEDGLECFCICDVSGSRLRTIGQLPQDKPSGTDILLRDFAWLPDNQHISLIYGDQKGAQLYLARA